MDRPARLYLCARCRDQVVPPPERARSMEKVRGTLGSMPTAQRQALEMAYFEGLSHSEISEKTGAPLGTIKTRIRSGLLALRKAFAT